MAQKRAVDFNKGYRPAELRRVEETLRGLHLAGHPKAGSSIGTVSRGASIDSSGGPDPSGVRERYRRLLNKSLRDIARLEQRLHQQLIGETIPRLPRCSACRVVISNGDRFCQTCEQRNGPTPPR